MTAARFVELPEEQGSRYTYRHAKAFFRWWRLRRRYPTLSRGLFFLDDDHRFEVGDGVPVHIGKGVMFMREFTGVFLGPTTIGDGTKISKNVYMSCMTGLRIGENCLIAEGVSIHDMDHKVGPDVAHIPLPERGVNTAAIEIGSNVWICSKATITRGVHIGDDVIIGAHALVTTDVPSHAVAVGSPARVVKSWASEIDERPSVTGP